MRFYFVPAPQNPPPKDPEEEQQEQLVRAFLDLGFCKGEAQALAAAWADPKQVSWWLEQGCSHRKAVQIAT